MSEAVAKESPLFPKNMRTLLAFGIKQINHATVEKGRCQNEFKSTCPMERS